MAFGAFSQFWCLQFRLFFEAPFTILLDSYDIIINPHLLTSNDALDEYRVLSDVVKQLFCDLCTSLALMRFITITLTKMC